MNKTKIEVINFKKSFGQKTVHEDINFFVREGECLGLLGGSGTGKSVLLRSLIGLEKCDSGKVLIDGEDITHFSERQFSSIRKKVAYAFQDGALFDSMTVFENLAYPLIEHTSLSHSKISTQIIDRLEEFGLTGTEHLYPANLSGGMQKRLGIARAMMIEPEVILFDEPTAGLDPFNTRRIQETILKLKNKGVTSVLVTHDMPTALAVCEKIAFLRKGKIVEQVVVEQFKENPIGIISEFMQGELS
ncbi:MAG TPA: ATP-binding cassette domain-containing protein [Pseudobdellovibrionaceae bacterium]|nr:ATP-binding cassette domain-containing protein [Pseudobdellovibrionaceae bacterium]